MQSRGGSTHRNVDSHPPKEEGLSVRSVCSLRRSMSLRPALCCTMLYNATYNTGSSFRLVRVKSTLVFVFCIPHNRELTRTLLLRYPDLQNLSPLGTQRTCFLTHFAPSILQQFTT